MNIKTDKERAEVYIKTRATRQLRENFRKCCEANNTDVTKVLTEFIKDYTLKNIRKVIEREK